MLKVNGTRVDTTIIYKGEEEKKLDGYSITSKTIITSVIDEKYEHDYQYPEIDDCNIELVNKNQINKAKRENKNFLYIDRQTNKSYFYVNENEIEKIEDVEERHEYRTGCISICDNQLITFKNIKVSYDENKHVFLKADDPYRDGDVRQIKDMYEDAKKTGIKKLIRFYKDKLDNNYKYAVLLREKETKTTNNIYIHNCVSREEKTAEYIKAEKITSKIQKIDERWSIYKTLEFQAVFALCRFPSLVVS